MSSGKGKHGGGILKHKSKAQAETQVVDSEAEHNHKEAPDKLEEEFRESFKARQRRRSAGTILPIAAERLKLQAGVNLNIPQTIKSGQKQRVRQISSEYCK